MVTTSKGFAQEPDEEGSESVCETLRPEEPGLYGLCIAFCEALGGTTTIVVDEPTTYPVGAEARVLEAFDKKAGEDGPEMPCVKYIYGECPYWPKHPGFDGNLASMISQMDDITVTEDLESNTNWYIFRISGVINGEPDLIELKGSKPENDTYHFPLVMWLHPYPERITYFPGQDAEAYMYERCKYDLEQMLF
jgi:hypothetical protein